VPNFDVSSIKFGEPLYLWLQFIPALLLILWAWQAVRRRRDVRHYRARHRTPARERISTLGRLPFWLCQLAALALTLLALSEPRAVVRLLRTAGVDIVVLQDGSASMYVRDVKPDRWQRSVRFLRVLAESLQWRDDRIALALFAHIAAPQVRLTRDPNTFFFFLDHLQRESPFPLREDTTWDTNIELGIHWGARLVQKDEELLGRSPNGKAFVLVSDGQAWSGEIEKALQLARSLDIPVNVVGVGTSYGGLIPQAPLEANQTTARVARATSPILSILDRTSLQQIATEGNGLYFDLERDGDRAVATTIVEAARRRAGTRALEESFEELHWYCLLAAAWLFGISLLLLRERAELWLMMIGAGAALAAVWSLIR
jgi:Ca-activated chloride channel family protein